MTVLFICLCKLAAFSQELEVPYTNNMMLFSHQKESFMISGDSIYNISIKPWKSNAHNLEMLAYKFISNDTVAYLVNHSNGIVYNFDGKSFERLDNSFEHKSQYGLFPFINKEELYSFGGYGLFTFKNIITRFNLLSRETELIESSNN